ncbi:hypothetical protein [Chryseobacterium sp. M5A1_1a]
MVTLNSGYIFSYSKFDGFCERLLAAELLVDQNFNFILQMRAFEHEKITKNGSNFFQESGELSGKIFDYFEQLIDLDVKSLKQNYDHITFVISDRGSQQFLINLDQGIEVGIVDELPLEYFETETELLLFEFNEYMKTWVEEKYQAWIK